MEDQKDDNFKRVDEEMKSQNEFPEESFWSAVCNNISFSQSCKAIVTRKPSSLNALDGFRAIAVLWVVSVHVMEVWPLFDACFPDAYYYAP